MTRAPKDPREIASRRGAAVRIVRHDPGRVGAQAAGISEEVIAMSWMIPGWMALGVVASIIMLIALVALFALWVLRPRPALRETPLAVAQRRYAAGQISREQFEEICRALSLHERADGHADVRRSGERI